jgi:hypothetical protein
MTLLITSSPRSPLHPFNIYDYVMIPEQSSEPHVNHAVDSQVSQVNGPTAPEDATMQVQDSVVPPDVAGVGKVDGNHAVTESTVRVI